MNRIICVLAVVVSSWWHPAQSQEFPFPTPKCGKTFITFHQTGTIASGTLVESTTYTSVRKTDILSLSKHPGTDSIFVIVFRTVGEPGYEIALVAPSAYLQILECLD